MKPIKRVCVVAFSLIAVSTNAQSQESGSFAKFEDPFRIYIGGFYPDMTSEVTINGAVIKPPPVGIEDALGIEDGKLIPYGGAKWRISRRNSLEFEYFKLDRNGFVDLGPDPIEVGDLLIESGTINTAFDTSVGRLTYGFSLSRSEKSDLQIKAGLHIAEFAVGLQLSGAVCDLSMGEMPPCPAGQTPPGETEDVTAPLPHFGLSWGYAITPNVAAEIRAMGFAIELNNIDGSIIELSGDVVWKPWDNFGLGAGFRYFNTNVKGENEDLNGEIDFEYIGPALFAIVSF